MNSSRYLAIKERALRLDSHTPGRKKNGLKLQVWAVSEGVLFALEIFGWGFTKSDQIQVLRSGSSCASSELEGSIMQGCPGKL